MVENFRSLHSRLDEIEYIMKEDGLSNLGKSSCCYFLMETYETQCPICFLFIAN